MPLENYRAEQPLNGRKVFKEVIPKVSNLIKDHLEENKLAAEDLKGMYLHQANENMNVLIFHLSQNGS